MNNEHRKNLFFAGFVQDIFGDTSRRIDQCEEESKGDGLTILLDHLIKKSGGFALKKGGVCGHEGVRGGDFQLARSAGVNSSPP